MVVKMMMNDFAVLFSQNLLKTEGVLRGQKGSDHGNDGAYCGA